MGRQNANATVALTSRRQFVLSAAALAATPYTTYTMNGYGEIQETQTAYLAIRTITKFGTEMFKMRSLY